MSDFWLIVILGVVQGITEFLPISSDGHLVLIGALLEAVFSKKLPDTITVTIVLHVGTLLAIIVVYWNRLWSLLGKDRRAIGLIIAGTIPAVIIGLPLREYGESILESPLLAAIGLLVTAAVLLWGARAPLGSLDYTELSYAKAVIIGIFQATAILPGVSRSGTTISAGLWMGLNRQAAASFSFLLAVPAIAGAALLETIKLVKADHPPGTSAGILVAGGIVSFVVGLFALLFLIRMLNAGRFAMFAWWCIPVGIIALIWQLSLTFGP